MKIFKTMLLAVVMILSTAATAQTTIAGGEFWIDGAIEARQSLSPGATIDISALTPGLHMLTMRVKGSNGLWSNQVARFFYVMPAGHTDAASVTACEYWIDSKKVSSATTLNTQVIDISDLKPGLHQLMVRVKDNLGIWSNQMTRIFYVMSDGRTDATNVTACEYWIDSKKVNSATTLNTQVVDISDLKPGLHQLMVRVKDNLGIWSNQMSRIFFVAPDGRADATNIVKREFWIDNQIAQRQAIDGTPAVIDISNLPSGLHMLTLRVQDDKGVWSNQMARLFFVAPLPDVTEYVLTKYMYWLDKDTEHAVTGDIAESDGKLVIDIEALSHDDDEHTFNLCVCDSRGVWSDLAKESFAELATGSKHIIIDLNNGDWYDISGKKLDAAPNWPGIYIHNGKKIVIK